MATSEREKQKPKLNKFERKEVLSATVAVTGAGDGLSQAMQVDPIELHHGEKRYLVLEVDVTKVRFDPVPKTDGLQRVHILKAGRATFIDADLVTAALDEQQKKIEEALGTLQLPFNDEQIDAMIDQHENGLHPDNAYEGCPSCDEARALLEHEKRADS